MNMLEEERQLAAQARKIKRDNAYLQKRATELEQLAKWNVRDLDECRKVIRELIERQPYNTLQHTGMHDHRCDYDGSVVDPTYVNPETVFRDHWRKENERQNGVNGGFAALELLLSPEIGHAFSSHDVPPISQRDCTVAATVIQWLGTNCGRCFLEECERDIRLKREDKAAALAKATKKG